MNGKHRAPIAAALLALLLAACGGDDTSPPIGAAGGTVVGPNGATLVIPAGALAQATSLQINEVDPSTVTLPVGYEAAGAIFAFTPHGTTFAMPVMVTVPFDPARVPAGLMPQFYKTTDTAQTQWQAVAGGTISGNAINAQISEFSLIANLVPRLPSIITQPADVMVDEGQSATFSVAAQPNNLELLSYQWQRDGIAIAGANGASYTLANVALGDSGALFSVIVDNGFGTVTSGVARLTVNNAQATGPWASLGTSIEPGTFLTPGGFAVARDGRVALSLLNGATRVGTKLQVREWNGTQWNQIGGDLEVIGNNRMTVTPGSVAYDASGQLIVAWRFEDFDGVPPATPRFGQFIRRWNGRQWEPFGPDNAFPWAEGDPQFTIDPLTQRLIAVTSNRFGAAWVREWDGTGWVGQAAHHPPDAISVGAGTTLVSGLIVLNSGQRLLAVRTGDANTPPNEYLAQLRGPDVNAQYFSNIGPPILPTPVPFASGVSLATDGIQPYALLGDTTNGPSLVRALVGDTWQSIGGDIGVRTFQRLLLVTPAPTSLPLVAYLQGASPARSVGAKWWDGSVWQDVASPSTPSRDTFDFRALLSPAGVPHVLLAERPTPTMQDLVVRRYAPFTLTLTVAGAAGSGVVSALGQTCTTGNSCSFPLPQGASVTLQATVGAGFGLQSWTGCDASAGLSCTVNLNQNRSVTATFQ